MTYAVKEIFYTLQGEGANTGKPAVFCRLSGCNLWSGREADRASATCKFCDTDFVGTDGTSGGKYRTASDLVDAIETCWPSNALATRFVVLTGGEPLLQVDEALIREFHIRRFEIAIETNGTVAPPVGIDWICVSPKAGAPLVLTAADEVKVVWPQPGIELETLETLKFGQYFLQPMDGPLREANTTICVEYCLSHPRWRLSLQTHKLLGIR